MQNSIIETYESRLKEAMLSSNIEELDTLLSDDLIFTDQTGSLYSKHDDIAAHKTGYVSIKSIDCSDQRINVKTDTAIVSVLMEISGIFGGNQATAKLRFTRTWYQVEQDKWQIIAAHSTQLIE